MSETALGQLTVLYMMGWRSCYSACFRKPVRACLEVPLSAKVRSDGHADTGLAGIMGAEGAFPYSG